MKFCTKCGSQLADNAAFCGACGCSVDNSQSAYQNPNQVAVSHSKQADSGLTIAAKVFMILGTVFLGFSIIPLAWCIPMTVSYFNNVKYNRPIGVGF
ncbi:MAG: zinc-ribbon domain-containing protein, partial [Oscillospiraceae bacterium]|nr:zinc-ribbon domain-containing protein [Oscillospiraceae bacterium]